jgi:hypothetical protein
VRRRRACLNTFLARAPPNRGRFWKSFPKISPVEKYFSEREKTRLPRPALRASFTKTVTVKVTNSVVMTEARRLIVGADGKAGQVAGRAFVSRFYLETTGLILTGLQKQEARSFLTGLLIGGIELKDRSVGGWRSGLQRSEK